MSNFAQDFGAVTSFREVFGETATVQETLHNLNVVVPQFTHDRLSEISATHFIDAVTQCYGAFDSNAVFRVFSQSDELPLLHSREPDQLWEELSRTVQSVGEARVELAINKKEYLATKTPTSDQNRVLVFYSVDAATQAFRDALNSPSNFENAFWGDILASEEISEHLPHLAIVIVTITGSSRGDYFSLLGGNTEFGQIFTASIAEAAGQQAYCFERARDKLYWESRWFRSLCPRHLYVAAKNRDASYAQIFRAIDALTTNTCLLYLAGRSWKSDQGIVARFDSESHQLDVQLFQRESDVSSVLIEQVSELLAFTEFAYERERFNDRLRFAQAAFGTTISSTDTLAAADVLTSASRIRRTAEWTWKSFCEERIDNYKKDTEDVDKDVRSTSEQFDAATSRLVDDMSKNVLSSIGAVITAFVAAGLKKEANTTAFKAVLSGFIFYLITVAGVMGLWFAFDRYKAARDMFVTKRVRHEALLGSSRVNELVGNTITAAQKRFKLWFGVSLAIYLITIAVLIWLIRRADELLK